MWSKGKSNKKQNSVKQQQQPYIYLIVKEHYKHNQNNKNKKEDRKQHTTVCLPSTDKFIRSTKNWVIQRGYKKIAYNSQIKSLISTHFQVTQGHNEP